MPFIPSPNIVGVEIRALLDGQAIENTLYFRSEAPPWTVAQMTTLANTIMSQWQANALPLLPTTYSLREIYVRDLTTIVSPAITQPIVGNSLGTGASPQLPNNASLCISFRTFFTGRSYRGRNYWPALMESQVTANTVAGASVNSIVAVYTSMQTAVQTALPAVWVVLSRYANGSPRPTGVGTQVTSVLAVDPTVDSQRRRLPGRGL